MIASLKKTFYVCFPLFFLASGAITVNEATGEDAVDCWSGLLPCQTLEFALEAAQYNESSEILLSEGTYILPHNESVTTFINKTGFVINGERNVTINCEDGAGLSFINTSNIELTNIAFIGCGFLHNSTSTDSTNSSNDGMKYLEFRAAIYFLFCYDVTFDGVTVTDSNGTGVVFYSTYGQVIIALSNFTNNSAVSGPGGGGVAVEFIYCAPGDVECNDTNKSDIPISNSEATYIFNNCRFLYNEGSTSNFSGDTFIVPRANHNVALGRGAGLSLLFKGNASKNTVSVSQCTFEGNKAVWGGAMLIEFQDDSDYNTVTVNSTVISDNYCYYNACTYEGTGGGGVRVQFAGFKDTVKNNTVNFINTQFVNNQAYFGGGVSFFTFPTTNNERLNFISFRNCTWYGNIARLGSAIDLSLWNLNATDGGSLVTKPEFYNCTFDSNSIHYTDFTGVPVGVGTLYAVLVPILFEGDSTFIDNIGSGIAGLDAPIELGINSTTKFIRNRAREGAGVLLFNNGFLKLNQHSHLIFTNNSADFRGGGIYWEGIGNHQLISSRNCFIRYKDSRDSINVLPSQWKAKIQFNNNKAVLSGTAIFATTLLGCLWDGQSYGHLLDPNKQYQQVFCWNSSIWDYGSDDCNSTENSIIATAPSYYANEHNQIKCSASEFNFNIFPGKLFAMNIFTLDDRLNRLPLNDIVFALHINSRYDNSTKFITNEDVSYKGDPFEVAELHLQTIQPRVISTKVNLTFGECPPGYIAMNDGICEEGNYTNVRYENNFVASIQFGYWMGHVNEVGDDWYVIQCLYCTNNPHSGNHYNYIHLPSNGDELDQLLCSSLNRTGIFCSDCIEGYGIGVNSDQFMCIDCSPEHKSYSWLLYLLFIYGPITVMLILVIIFNISVTSGPANAFIFFAQIISTTYGVDAGGIINYQSISPIASGFRQFYTAIYGIWNLDFFTSIDYHGWLFCLGPDINALHVIALKYIAALYPLLVLLIIIVLLHLYDNNYRIIVCIFRPLHKLSARCLHRLNLQRSIMDSFATFLIFSYVKFAVISCNLLYPCPLETANGEIVRYVSVYDGNIKFNSLEYTPYLISSLIVIILCFVLPFFLLLYSIKPCYQCLQKYHFHRLEPGIKLQHFLNSFHHCFKDSVNGGHDRRYFAAVYFYFKLALILTWALGFDWTKQYIMQQVVCTVALFMVGILQPYKKVLHNVLDLCLFSILSIINVLTIYNKDLQASHRPLSKTSFYIIVILILVPLVYIIGYILFFLFKTIKQKKRKEVNLYDHPDRDRFSFNTFMNDVNTEDRFERNNYYGSIGSDDDDDVQQQKPEEMIHVVNADYLEYDDEQTIQSTQLRSMTY